MIITIVSLIDQVLNFNIPTYKDYKFLSDLFKSNTKGDILRVQVASKDFKSRLKIFDDLSKTNRNSLAIKAVFDKIPEDSKFVVVPGKIDDSILLYHLREEVNKLNGIANTTSDLDKMISQITSLYYTQSFNGNAKQRQYIGEADKSNRICRFCGQQVPVVSFKNKAHAISESLGNKSIICREECDICNERFSRTIEPDIANMLSSILTIYSIHGKNGIRTTTGKNFKLSLEESTPNDSNVGTVTIQLQQEFPENIEDLFNEQLSLDASSLKYIPQNVYKCLCKYVVSVIDKQYLSDFKKTIDWINSPTRFCKLPIVAIGDVKINTKAPNLIVSIRKINKFNYPYCFAIFVVGNFAFAFIIPFTSKDKYHFTTPKKYKIFQDMIQSWYKGVNWSYYKLSSSKRTYTRIDFTLQIHPECKLGKDYFILDKKI